MVALPIDGTWSVHVLNESDRARVFAFLDREPLLHVYLRSKVLDYGLGGVIPFLEILHDGGTVCIAAVGSNVVVAVDMEASPEVRDAALELLADRILMRYLPVRAIISDSRLVEALWTRLRSRLDPPTVIRLNQPVYSLGHSDLPDLHRVRYSLPADLDQLVFACAAMHREEVGIDPLARDPYGYRQRVSELIDRKRSLVLVEKGRIVFKSEFSAVTDDAVQLMGVWTSPLHRRRGLAREGLAEICGHILRQRKTVTLFVNDFNAPAIALYESLGFVRIGENRALIW